MNAHTFERIAVSAPFHDAGYGFDVFGLHPPALAAAVDAAAPLYERYFRVDSRGAERIPARGAAILVANRAGVLPVDAAMLCIDVLRRTDPPRIPRPIADQLVPKSPIVSTWFARLGVVAGTRANVRHLIETGELVVIFRGSSVSCAELAIRHGVPVVPVALIATADGWPARYHIRYAAPLRFAHVPSDADEPRVVAAAAAHIEDTLEELFYSGASR